MKTALLCAMLALPLWAQPVYVYSEFVNVDAQGKVAVPSRPREILSPAIVRNAFSSFQLVIEAAEAEPWSLHIGQNPEDSVKVTMYREKGTALEPVELPVKGRGTQVFWMDLWTAADAPTGRIKVEPELNIDDDWVIYPMEVRVQDPVVPAVDSTPTAHVITQYALMRAFVCNSQIDGSGIFAPGLSVQDLRYRNTMQDIALAQKVAKPDLQKAFGSCQGEAPANPEAYYSIRDFLFRHELH